jgi:uncharacterized protein (TIGR01619 family)
MKKFIIVSTIILLTTAFLQGENILKKHEEKWDFYFTNINGKPSSIFLDLGYRDELPLDKYFYVAWISVTLNDPNPNGLSTESEMDQLNAIEESLVKFFAQTYKAMYVGRVTGDGKRVFSFYIKDKAIKEKSIQKVFATFPSYKMQYIVKEDQKWDGYNNFLYPDSRQIQCMQNVHVLENLKSHGDDLTKERRVDHWFYFKTKNDADNVKKEVLKLNYEIQKIENIDNYEPYIIVLQIYRTDHVDLESINAIVLQLFDLSEKYNANYDGWETSVEK